MNNNKISYVPIIEQIIKNNPEKLNLDDLKYFKRDFAKLHKLSSIPTNIQLLKVYHTLVQEGKIQKNRAIEKLLRKRAIRSQSGIVAVQVLTKPFWCPWKCIFCPNDPEMPKSYIKTEPWAMRALLNQFDPVKQVYNRLLSLSLTGHSTDKIEMIVLWWTRDVYPDNYKIEFIKALYDACNTFDQLKFKMKDDEEEVESEVNKKKFWYTITNLDEISYPESVEESIKINETAKNRVIGLTIETRPEYVNDENCREWRELWVTRLEMGVQSLDENVLNANERGHDTQCIKDAIHKLRQYGFKFSIHIMPWLYQATQESDIQTMKEVYADPNIKPDEMKFYPTSVIPNTWLYDLYKSGEYTPITTQEIKNIVEESFENIIPPYSRIKRLIRDIPSTEIESGSNITNLAQLIHQDLKKKYQKDEKTREKFYFRLYGDFQILSQEDKLIAQIKKDISINWLQEDEIKTYILGECLPELEQYRNFVSLDTRSREIRNRNKDKSKDKSKHKEEKEQVNTIIRVYKSSVGIEMFISKEDELGYLYGFTRLLLPDNDQVITDFEGIGESIAMIRELHIYGQLAKIGKKEDNQQQHKWFWTELMEIAEEVSRYFWYQKLSVISGVWVRGFYQKLWYSLEWTYMVKKID